MLVLTTRYARSLIAAVILLLVMWPSSCSTPLGPTEAIPPPVLGLDSVVVGAVLFGCSEWQQDKPPASQRLIVDVFFGRAGPNSPPDRPLNDDLAEVESLGGEILHVFHFPAARVNISSRSIPDLETRVGMNHARTVPYSDRFDWKVMVGYSSEPSEEDLARFRDLGGELIYVFTFTPMISGILPDQSFPVLRADPRVSFVEAGGIYCRMD